MVEVVRHVRALKEKGWELYCWSSGGADYARESAIELKIEDCFVGFLPKPGVMIDDVSPESWSFLKIVHPREIKEPIQSVETTAAAARPPRLT